MEEKTYSKNGITLHNVHFSSVLEFLHYIEEAPAITPSNSSREGSYNFTGTSCYPDAFDMCKNGYFDENVKNFQQRFVKIQKQFEKKTNLSKTKHDLQGFVPDVPQYLTGNPMNMINAELAPNGKKPATVVINYNVATRAYEERSTMERRGLAALVLYQILSNLKFNVKFTNTQLVTNGDAYVKIDIDLIKRGEMLNLSKIYFPLVHPSFLRRLIFAFEERDPFLKNRQDFFFGYGMPTPLREYPEPIANLNENTYSINTDEFNYSSSDLKSIVKSMIIKLGKDGLFKDNTGKLLSIIDEIDFSMPESIIDDENDY